MKRDSSLNSLYEDVKGLGLASNQYEFSILCGRTPAWFSMIKARKLSMTSDALLTLSYKLQLKADETVDECLKQRIKQLSDDLVLWAQLQIAGHISPFSGCPLL